MWPALVAIGQVTQHGDEQTIHVCVFQRLCMEPIKDIIKFMVIEN